MASSDPMTGRKTPAGRYPLLIMPPHSNKCFQKEATSMTQGGAALGHAVPVQHDDAASAGKQPTGLAELVCKFSPA